jgi:hypothetical protein
VTVPPAAASLSDGPPRAASHDAGPRAPPHGGVAAALCQDRVTEERLVSAKKQQSHQAEVACENGEILLIWTFQFWSN